MVAPGPVPGHRNTAGQDGAAVIEVKR